MHQQTQETISAAAAKAAPPVTVVGMTIAGYSLSDWVLVATLIYTLLQTILLVRRLILQRRSGDRDPACAEDCPAVRRRRKEGGYLRPRMAVAGLALSAAGLVGLALHEGYTDRAVIPVKGDVPTIGFGATSGVRLGDTTTPPKALARALTDAQQFEGALKRCVTVPLHQHEYDAFVSLSYNIGADAFCRSTLVRRLNAGDYAGACAEILRWNRFQGRVLPGLDRRRQAEYQQCMGG